MIIAEILGSILVIVSLASFSQGWMRNGFFLNLLSNAVWAIVATDAQLWGLLALQGGLVIFNIRGLLRLAKAVSHG